MNRFAKSFVATALMAGAIGGMAQTSGTLDPLRDVYHNALSGKKIVFVSFLLTEPLSQGWYHGLKDTFEPLGVKVEARDANLSTSAGAQALTQAIAQKPSVIVVQNPDLTAYARLIQQAEAAGIHVLSINLPSKAPGSGYIGPDWTRIGEMLAESSVEACKGKSGKVAIIQGSVTAANNLFMMNGINAVLAKNSQVKVVSNQAADWDTAKAKSVSTTILKQNPDMCAVMGSWDGMDLGIAAAVKEAGLTGKTAVLSSGGGSQESGCNQVKSGSFDSYISYNLVVQVSQLTTMVAALLTAAPKPGTFRSVTYTPLTRIDKSNSAQPGLCTAAKK